jgi:hypothetical protein
MGWWEALLLALYCCLPAAPASAFPSQYANALQRAQYTVRAGNYDGDGLLDLLLIPKRRVIIIDFDVPVPVIAKPASPAFVLLSGGGNYSLTANPSAAVLNSTVWQTSSYSLTYGDTLANGSVNLLLQALSAGKPSFLITTSPTDGQPQLLENLSVTAIGVDLSAASTVSSLQDINWDGRADLVVYANGTLSTALVAAANGTFAPPPAAIGGAALAAWRAFCAALTVGDATSASSLLSSVAQTAYGAALAGLGATPDISSVAQTWSEPSAVTIAPDFAVFALTQVEYGQTKLHLVALVLENGRWVVESL